MHTEHQLRDRGAHVTAATTIEARKARRVRTVYRVARIRTRDDHGLARVLDLSDGGMMLETELCVRVGTRITVDLSETITVSGQVRWIGEQRCGVGFDDPIDCTATLKRLYREQVSDQRRPLRIQVRTRALTRVDGAMSLTSVRDLSQKGMCLRHDGRLKRQQTVTVQLTPDIECQGEVVWATDIAAGIRLSTFLTVRQLGSIRALRHAA